MRSHGVVCAFALFAATAIAGAANGAEACSARYMKMIVANPPGGVGDLIARTVAEGAAAELKQSIVVENRPGASTTIGTDFVAKSKPDGCTILSLTASGVVVTVLREKLPYDLQRDFVPIITIGSFPMALAVAEGSKIRSMADLANAAKSADGITYSSGGAGTLAHLSAVRLINDIGGKGTHVPYRGNPDAIQALLGNQVQLFFPSTAEALTLAKGGKIRLLGVTSESRIAALPDVPTMKELGFADFNPRLWFAFLAPAGTPPGAISRLHESFAKAVGDPTARQRLTTLGFAIEVRDPAATTALMKSEGARWGKVIKDNDIKSTD
jgi:tripartite-type tricarboxylate transporter receptor subunit TctC